MLTAEGFWDKFAEKYDRDSQNKGPNYAARLERAAAVLQPDDHVLDVGCASGEITLDLAPRCASILGIDLGGKLIDMARAKAVERGVTNARFERIDVIDPALPVPEAGVYDAITVYSVFHLITDWRAVLRRLHGLLPTGGHMLTETPCLRSKVWFVWPMLLGMKLTGKAPPVVHFLSVAQLESAIGEAGFEILDSQVYNPKSGQHCILARKA